MLIGVWIVTDTFGIIIIYIGIRLKKSVIGERRIRLRIRAESSRTI